MDISVNYSPLTVLLIARFGLYKYTTFLIYFYLSRRFAYIFQDSHLNVLPYLGRLWDSHSGAD
jgi:hypothetical protein